MNEEITMRVSAHRGSRRRGQTATVVDDQQHKKEDIEMEKEGNQENVPVT